MDFNVPCEGAGVGDVEGVLHAHEGLHIDAEGFFETEGHFAGEAGVGVEQGGEGGAGDLEDLGGLGYGEAVGFDDFGPEEVAGVDGIEHAPGRGRCGNCARRSTMVPLWLRFD